MPKNKTKYPFSNIRPKIIKPSKRNRVTSNLNWEETFENQSISGYDIGYDKGDIVKFADGEIHIKVLFPPGESMWVWTLVGDENHGVGTLLNHPILCTSCGYGSFVYYVNGSENEYPKYIRELTAEQFDYIIKNHRK